MEKTKREVTDLLVWLGISAFFIIESLRLGLGGVHAPGPGFLPFWVGILVAILTAIEFGRSLSKEGQVEETQPMLRRDGGRKMLYVLIFIFAYPFFIEKLGFFLCTLLFCGGCLRIIGRRSWAVVAGLTIFITLFAYFVFAVWLGLLFPEGKWVAGLYSIGRDIFHGAH